MEGTGIITHGSLASGGVDGMAMGAERLGIETIWNCEIDPYARMLLKQDYPKAKQYTDATKDIPEHRPTIISITSECQDISIGNPSAAGVFGHRSILIFDCLNICGQLKPDYIVIENSAAITKRGLEYVLCKLSEIGYDAAWHCLPLTAFKVQLRRERLYLIARANKIGLQRNPIQEVFSESIIQEQFKGVSPG